MMKYYEELTLLAEEKQDGVDCYHLSFKVNLEKVLEQFLGADVLKTLLLGSANAEVKLNGMMNGEIWTGKSDFIPRKYVMSMELEVSGQTLNIKLTMDFSKINQPVEMPQVP